MVAFLMVSTVVFYHYFLSKRRYLVLGFFLLFILLPESLVSSLILFCDNQNFHL